MPPDNVEVSWDTKKSRGWFESQPVKEVIRRYCSRRTMQMKKHYAQLAQKTVTDEGYDSAPAQISIQC